MWVEAAAHVCLETTVLHISTGPSVDIVLGLPSGLAYDEPSSDWAIVNKVAGQQLTTHDDNEKLKILFTQ